MFAPTDVASRVEDQASSEYLRRYGAVASHVEIEVVRVTGDVDGEAGFTIDWPDSPPHGTVQVRLTGNTGTAGWAMMRIRHLDYAAQAERDIAAGDEMHPSDLTYSLVDLSKVRGEPLTEDSVKRLAAGGEIIAQRSIRAGRAIRTIDVANPPIAEVGASIVMDYERAGIRFSLTCTAREAGSEGDAIRLYSSDTRSTYRARLTGPGTAQWIETL